MDEKWYLHMLYLQVLYVIGNVILQLLTVWYKCKKYVDETWSLRKKYLQVLYVIENVILQSR